MTLDEAFEALVGMGHVALVNHGDHLCQGKDDRHPVGACPYPPSVRYEPADVAPARTETDLHQLIVRKLRAHQKGPADV